MKICIAIGGSSGAIYAQRLLKKLQGILSEEQHEAIATL